MKETIGIVGAGAMGSGIAQVAVEAGHPVILYDAYPEALERSRKKFNSLMERLIAKGKRTEKEVASNTERLRYEADFSALKGADWVIEAAVEDMEIKKDIFARLERNCHADCVLATNTSSLSVSGIASACEDPSRVMGLHFFNPAPLMALVEVIPAIQTAEAQVERAMALMKSWNKSPVRAKDTPAFIVNRVARPFYGEALRIYEEGLADAATIDWAMTELGGFKMGPFTLMDFIGHDVNYKVTQSVFEAFYYDPRYKPSFAQKNLVDAGWLGRKTGRGFYDYSEGAKKPEPDTDRSLGEMILWRILVMLINEAADAYYWRVADRDAIDLAMTKGVNYPKGLLKWADEKGIDNCIATLDRLHSEYLEDRYRCSPLLRHMHRNNRVFYETNS